MRKKILILGMMLIVISTMLAMQNSEFQSRVEREVERHRQNFANGRTSLRNSGIANIRSPLLEEIIIQFPDWEEPDTWYNDEKIKIYYDNRDRISELHFHNWDYEEENEGYWLDPFVKVTVEWMDGDLIEKMVYSVSYWDYEEEDIVWLDMSIYSHYYNDSNQIELVTMEMFDFIEEEWFKDGYVNFFYEDDMVTNITFNWLIDDEWREFERDRVVFEYDQNGRIETIYDEYMEDEEWLIYGMSVVEYHHSDETTYSDVQNFFNQLAMFMNFLWFVERNPFGKAEMETMYEWDYEEEEWYYIYRDVKQYNEHNYLTAEYFEMYDEYYEEWITHDRTLLTYDDDWNVVETLEQWFDNEEELWVNYERTLLSYKTETTVEEHTLSPALVSIGNFPNPFNPETTIVFNIPQNQHVNISIYNVKGQVVRNLADGVFNSGQHKIVWNGKHNDGSSLSSGVYFYRLDTEERSLTGKMMMLK